MRKRNVERVARVEPSRFEETVWPVLLFSVAFVLWVLVAR